jgi:tellurite resistance protein
MATTKKRSKISTYVMRCLVLGACAQHCEKRELASSCPSVSTHGTLDAITSDLILETFNRNCVDRIQVWSK